MSGALHSEVENRVKATWEKHSMQGQTGAAAVDALNILRTIPTTTRNKQDAAARAEVSRLAFVLQHATAKQSPHLVQALPHLLKAQEIASAYYPVGNDMSRVRDRARLDWNYAYENVDAYTEAVRDVWKYIDTLVTLFKEYPEMQQMQHGLQEILTQASEQEKESRGALLATLEMSENDFSEVEAAYEQLMQRFTGDLDFVVYISGQYFVRAMSTGHLGAAARAFYSIVKLGGVGLATKVQHVLRPDYAKAWRKQLEQDQGAVSAGIRRLRAIPAEWQYMAAGKNSVQKLR